MSGLLASEFRRFRSRRLVKALVALELLAIVALAAKTNHLATGLQVPIDRAFDADATP